MKKDELIAKVAKLESEVERLRNNDSFIRQEFSKAFRWGRPRSNPYDFNRSGERMDNWDWETPTWEQVFVEVGKLKSLMDYRDFDGNVSELECKLEDIESRIKPWVS